MEPTSSCVARTDDLHNEGAELDIGEVQARSGLAASTLHVWERHNLITPSSRKGLRRQYPTEVMERIAVVVVCQRAGFTLDEIAELLDTDERADGDDRLATKIAELETQRAELDRAITGLTHALACTAPSPLRCEGFRSKLADVLPVRR